MASTDHFTHRPSPITQLQLGRRRMHSMGSAKKVMCFLVICLASQPLTPSMGRGLGGGAADNKAYYSPPDHSDHGGSGTPGTNPPTSHGSPPSGGYYNPPPSSTPVVVVPTPTTPTYPTPTSPILPPGTPLTPIDPNCPPFTCDYWRNHPNVISALIGFWCPVAQIFGLPNPAAFATTNPTVMDALVNTRRDGIGELYREATAAFLNSLADRHFYFTGQQVRDAFGAAVGSDRAASAQARLFKRANEGRLKRG